MGDAPHHRRRTVPYGAAAATTATTIPSVSATTSSKPHPRGATARGNNHNNNNNTYAGWAAVLVFVVLMLVIDPPRYSTQDYWNTAKRTASSKLGGNSHNKHDYSPAIQELLDQGHAVETTIDCPQPPMKFSMLVFPPESDPYISAKLVQKPINYELDNANFVHLVLQAPTASDGLRGSSAGLPRYWAVDLGANLGFHTLHMAQMQTAKILALEPAPDTFALLQASLQQQQAANNMNSVTLINAGAAEQTAQHSGLFLARHPKSPGMTTLSKVQDLPGAWGMKVLQDEKDKKDLEIPLMRVEELLEDNKLPEHHKVHKAPTPKRLRLLKVDVEGFELLALKGLNLDRYPFEYILMEYFPQLLRASHSMEHPKEVLEYLIIQHGYLCVNKWDPHWESLDESVFQDESKVLAKDAQAIQKFAEYFEGSHTNLYCKSSDRPVGL